MKMESSRITFLQPEFTTIMRTSSDPNQQSVRNVRLKTASSNVTRSLSTSPENRKLNLPKSPQISKLTRADSYRIKPKESVVAMSNIERRKKSKERRHMRSQSSPMFPQDIDVTDPNLGKIVDNLSNESLKENDSDFKRSPSNGRKKSFNALKELKIRKLIEETTKPILNRSQSQKFAEKPPVVTRRKDFATDEDDDSDHSPKQTNGPLFQATTLFVPGYDFKTKSSTLPRKSSTPQLPRRSSKERMSVLFDKVITRQTSSPCLLKRDSKEKMKKLEQPIEEKIIETPSPEIKRTPPPIITLSNDVDERISSSPDENISNDTCLVKQRKAAIALRQKQFREKGTTKSMDCTPTSSIKVKQIASGYDDGSVFVKVRNLANKTSELSINDSVYNNSFNKQTESYTILEKPCDMEYKSSRSILEKTYDNEFKPCRSYNGTESGYASLTDSVNLEKDIFSNTWSHHDWRDFSTDLCVTEL